MPSIPFGTMAYRRDAGGLPELRLVNMFAEKAPTASGGVALLSRPGLTVSATRGLGPIRGLFSREGVFNGDVFSISAARFYRGDVYQRNIDGTGTVRFSSSATEILLSAGRTPYSYNGTTTASIDFPDAASVAGHAYLAGLFVYLRADTHRFYWSSVNDARTIDPLDFASAESAPDKLLDILAIGENLYLLGQATIEVWASTGAAELPFARIQQRLYRKGVISSGCAAEVDNSLFWIGDDGIVYRAAEIPVRLSDHGIEERIAQSTTISAFAFTHEGHQFFCIRLDENTYAYDAATQQWCEFATYDRDNFAAQASVDSGRSLLLGDDSDGSLYSLSGFADGNQPLERLFTAAFPIKGGTVAVDNLAVEANFGTTDLLAGQGSDPVMEMRSSRNAGATWSPWRSARLGTQGQYRRRAIWRRCGQFDAPGAMFEFRCTDPVDLRISDVKVNEAGGGRAR